MEATKEKRLQDEMVSITFETRADLEEMTDEDYIKLGKFVAEVAAEARDR